jgi:hypothetical protein
MSNSAGTMDEMFVMQRVIASTPVDLHQEVLVAIEDGGHPMARRWTLAVGT